MSRRRSSPPPPLPPAEPSRLFAALGLTLSDDQSRRLASYVDLLMRWSRGMSLTGFKTPGAAAEGLLLDAVGVEALLPRGSAVVDVGAGAGGLATALAVLRPDLALHVVESRARRAAFLRAVRRELRLASVTVVEGRVEEVGLRGLDAAYARALMAPLEWQALGLTLVRPGGRILCLTAHPLEASERDPGLDVVGGRSYVLPSSGLPRVVTALAARGEAHGSTAT